MGQTDMSYMAPFTFPDPAVQDAVIHPDTGEYWVYEGGVWMVSDEDPCGPDSNLPSPTTPSPPTHDDDLEVTIGYLRAEIATLRQDIIELRAQLTAATVNNFLILE